MKGRRGKTGVKDIRSEDGSVFVNRHVRQSALVSLQRLDRFGKANIPQADLTGEAVNADNAFNQYLASKEEAKE
jgi:hypothetical protein